MTRWSAMLALALAPANACRETAPTSAPARRVLLVTCDTLRADRLPVYGYPRPTAPVLDALAREGVVFDTAWSSAPWTLPSVASLLTGLLPHELGVAKGNTARLSPDARTLQELALESGCATAAVVSNPVLESAGVQDGGGFEQGFQTFDDACPTVVGDRPRTGRRERVAPDTATAAIEILERWQASGVERGLLWVHFMDPHGPYDAPPQFEAHFAGPPTDEPPLEAGQVNSGRGALPLYQQRDGERRPEVYRQRYDAEIRYFDTELGRLFDWLRAAGWWEDTLVIFTADHGESLGEKGYWFCHGETLQRELCLVPLIVKPHAGAGEITSSRVDGVRRVRIPVAHVDIAPTVCDALSLPAPPMRGSSLFDPALPAQRLLGQVHRTIEDARASLAVSDGQWRAVRTGREGAWRLHDLCADPGELVDLAPDHPREVDHLTRSWLAELDRELGPQLGDASGELDPEQARALGLLGYTDEGD